jgi:S-methylmethionine-dependent homocysteine/selenocysteine methylase
VIETPTWRANPDWAARLGYAPERLDAANRAAVELDEGDPNELAAQYVALRSKLPAVTVLGGCCGTDARHVAAICAAWVAGD